MLRPLVVTLLFVSACGDDTASQVPDAARGGPVSDGGSGDPGPADGSSEPVNPLEGIGDVELVAAQFRFIEGPVWVPSEAVLLFSDILANVMYQLTPPSTITVFRSPSGQSNGLALDRQGRLLAAEHGTRRVSRTLENGEPETLVATYEGQRFNSPNDLVVRSDGTIYFTDPPYGLLQNPSDRELPFNGVFRLSPAGELVAEWQGPLDSRPNGVALSPDETRLYVADTETAGGLVRVYDVAADGSLSQERVFIGSAPQADGMAVDAAGNLYVTTGAGVAVHAPEGTLWGIIELPSDEGGSRVPANCAFGDADRRTLYITARQGLYRVRLAIAGAP